MMPRRSSSKQQVNTPILTNRVLPRQQFQFQQLMRNRHASPRHLASPRHASNLLRISATVDLPRDACPHRLLVICANSSSSFSIHVAFSHWSSASSTGVSANHMMTRGANSAKHTTERIIFGESHDDKSASRQRAAQSDFDTSRFATFVETILIPHTIVPIIHSSKDLVTGLDQYIASRQRKIDEEELCSTQPTFHPEEDVSVHTLTNLEVHDVTQVEDYLIETSEECEVFQIEPEIVIALNEGEDEMNIDVNSDKPEKPQIESEEDQLLVLVQPPTLPCIFGTPYKAVEVRERLQIFYTTDTFVLDDPDTIDSFVLEVLDELLNLKEGVHASLPNYVDAPFVVDISKGEGIM
ncbi:hypothetical protein Syun_020529 [Stephania yunnanensis]|uniref:Uncharacterized protein n=1 Tax=Stephania yunnanensis TaxID=152371 RepID=A0AAP0IFW0_9MAGN